MWGIFAIEWGRGAGCRDVHAVTHANCSATGQSLSRTSPTGLNKLAGAVQACKQNEVALNKAAGASPCPTVVLTKE